MSVFTIQFIIFVSDQMEIQIMSMLSEYFRN